MSTVTQSRWESMRTDESRTVEDALRKTFQSADAYRYNSASIRVRVVDPRFEGKSDAERDSMVEPVLKQLPTQIQADIINLLTLSPNETTISPQDPSKSLRGPLLNLEFEDPSPSGL